MMAGKISPLRSKLAQDAVLLISVVLGSYSYWFYRNNIAIYVGLLAASATLVHELYGTKRGWWSYHKSVYMVAGRVPIGIPVTYFFLGMLMVAYMLFRGA